MTSGPLHEFADAFEKMPGLDGPVSVFNDASEKLTENEDLREILSGSRIGTHLHPGIVHMPIGMAVGALVVDLTLGDEGNAAAGVLSGATLATAVPAIVTGLADYERIPSHEYRRLGAAHALANVAANTLTLVSLVGRLAGARTLARLTLAGAVTSYLVGGLLGGHLAHSEDSPTDEANQDESFLE
ncbi:MAG: hypothetical protein Q4G64_06260 [bacterium]|nr:hypothetical protein [bacterium]